MRFIKFLAFERDAYYFKLITIIFLLSKIMSFYFCHIKKRLIYITLAASFSR